jgi:hypothetical protein
MEDTPWSAKKLEPDEPAATSAVGAPDALAQPG